MGKSKRRPSPVLNLTTDYPLNLRVLALDFGTTLGWATLANGVLDSGSRQFQRQTGRKTIPDDPPGQVFLDVHRWLREFITDLRPNVIAYEETMFLSYYLSACTLNGIRGIVLMNSAYSGIPLMPINPSTMKQFATGKSNAKKDLILAAAYTCFPEVEFACHDQADAVFLLHYYLAKQKEAEAKATQ